MVFSHRGKGVNTLYLVIYDTFTERTPHKYNTLYLYIYLEKVCNFEGIKVTSLTATKSLQTLEKTMRMNILVFKHI